MGNLWKGLLLMLAVAACMWGIALATGASDFVREEMAVGDREQEWAMVYFESWRQTRDGSYLVLSRERMTSAIIIWFDLQVKIGHSFPDFYNLDRRRRRGCKFLAEIDRLANRFKVAFPSPGRTGCLLSSQS